MAHEYRMFIAGEWTGSESGATFEAISPSTGAAIGTLSEGTREDVRRAVGAAADTFGTWSRLTAFERGLAMRRVSEAIDRRRDDLAHTLALDQGEPMRAKAFDEVEELIAHFENLNKGTNSWEFPLPFGGRAGSASGAGRVGGRFPIERLTELKTIVVHLG